MKDKVKKEDVKKHRLKKDNSKQNEFARDTTTLFLGWSRSRIAANALGLLLATSGLLTGCGSDSQSPGPDRKNTAAEEEAKNKPKITEKNPNQSHKKLPRKLPKKLPEKLPTAEDTAVEIPEDQREAFNLLGRGRTRSVGGALAGSCITGDKPTPYVLEPEEDEDVKPDGQKISSHYKLIESRHDIREDMDFGLSGDGFYNGVSASAAVKISKSFKSSDTQKNILYRVTVQNAEMRMRNIRLKDDARQLMQKDLGAFYARCGKEAIIGYMSGGEANALIKVKSFEKIKESEVNALLQASGFGFGVESELKKSTSDRASQYSLEIEQYLVGGKSLTLGNTVDGVVKLFSEWPKHVATHPVVYKYITVPYSMFEAELANKDEQIIKQRLSYYSKEYDKLLDMERMSSEVIQSHNRDLEAKLIRDIGGGLWEQLSSYKKDKNSYISKRDVSEDEKNWSRKNLSSALETLKNDVSDERLALEQTLSHKIKSLEKGNKTIKILGMNIYYAILSCYDAHLGEEYERACITGDISAIKKIAGLKFTALEDLDHEINNFSFVDYAVSTQKKTRELSWSSKRAVYHKLKSPKCPGYQKQEDRSFGKHQCGTGVPACPKDFHRLSHTRKKTGYCGTKNRYRYQVKCRKAEVIKSCTLKKGVETVAHKDVFHYESQLFRPVVN